MFFIVVGVVVGVFIEQTYPLPKLREVMKCAKKYGETEDDTETDVPNPTNLKPHDTDLDNETDETAHAD